MRSGIAACIVSHVFIREPGGDIHFPSAAAVRRANLFAAEQSERNPGRLYFMAYLNPQEPDWEQELDRCLARGARGIKLWVSLKDRSGSLERTVEVLKRAARLDQTVYLHVFNRTGGNLPGEINMEELAELARTVPGCRMIAGHSGGNWRQSAAVFGRNPCPDNVWMEIGGSNPDYGMADGILKFCPPERLLYGSDGSGRGFFPQLWKVLESSLSRQDRELVLGRNILHLLRLPEPPPLPDSPDFSAPGRWCTIPEREPADYCCFCGDYPFESRPPIPPEKLEEMLAEEHTETAFTADFGAVFGRDPESANREFLCRCRSLSRVKPLAAIHPVGSGLQTELDSILADPGWCGLWLSPAFHHWRLDDPGLMEFFRRCASAKKMIFLNFGFYEPRFSHPDLKIREVPDEELERFLAHFPFEHCVIQGKNPPPGTRYSPRVSWCCIRLTDSPSGLADQLKNPNPPRIVRGSEFPFRHLRETLAAAAAQLNQNGIHVSRNIFPI